MCYILHRVHKTDKVWVEFACSSTVAALDYSSAAADILRESRVEGSDSQVKHVRVDHFLLQVHREMQRKLYNAVVQYQP